MFSISVTIVSSDLNHCRHMGVYVLIFRNAENLHEKDKRLLR